MGERIRVGTLAELRERGVAVVSAPHWRIAVFADGDELHAVDNRCPHMGFPLERGTLRDGILTCHWHQARFDLRSGCTFDLFADDVHRFATEVRDGVVFVSATPQRVLDAEHHLQRLRRGMEQDVPLVQAKSLLALFDRGLPLERIAGEAAAYGSRNLAGFDEGMVRLGCVANLYPFLERETAYQALLYAIRQIAARAQGSVPRREREPLDAGDHPIATLERWMRGWIQTRHRDAAERTLLTAVHQGLPASDVAGLLFGAACERLYADGGHALDFANKAFELVELLGWDEAGAILPMLMPQLAEARGEEESTAWHHPIEIAEPLRQIERRLPELLERGRGQTWKEDPRLLGTLLGDDPLAILEALETALAAGAPPAELSQRVAHAAALRLARFPISNEVGDWLTCQHTFHHANAVDCAVRRSASPNVVRAIFQAAIAVYSDRYLNVPPARLPSERGGLEALPSDPEDLRGGLLDALDQRGSLETAARLVSRYLRLGHPVAGLIDTLTLATVREDLDFHTLQSLEAGVRQYRNWEGRPEAEQILVGVARGLAAQCPTRRAGQQTALIALRLHRGDDVYAEQAPG